MQLQHLLDYHRMKLDFIYEHRPVKRKITLAFKQKQEIVGKFVDMVLKKERNKEALALYDK